jgi:hypothetical protein
LIQNNIGLLQTIYEQQQIRFGNAFKNKQTILRDLFQPNRKESEETIENPSAKWTHLAYKREFSQTNARFERYLCLFTRQISGGRNY